MFLSVTMLVILIGNWKWICRYEFQMQYGSIGWSVGATLGYAQAVPEKRVISFIGDGSFQVCTFDHIIRLTNSGIAKVILEIGF